MSTYDDEVQTDDTATQLTLDDILYIETHDCEDTDEGEG